MNLPSISRHPTSPLEPASVSRDRLNYVAVYSSLRPIAVVQRVALIKFLTNRRLARRL